MTLSLCTWNINSVRLRLPLLERLIHHASPDVICLQETKCPDALFPVEAITALGYAHQAFRGMKSYNGVAILSKHPLEAVDSHMFCERDDCRHISVVVSGINIHNFYVPAGGDEADAVQNPKFAHKLAFLAEMEHWFLNHFTPEDSLVLTGDLNIAPLPCDVWDHRNLLKVVSHTPAETDALGRIQKTLGWLDTARFFIPPPHPLFTWWSYRSPDWTVSNRGRRLDHLWVTPVLQARLSHFTTIPEARSWDMPSDHIPVLLTLSE